MNVNTKFHLMFHVLLTPAVMWYSEWNSVVHCHTRTILCKLWQSVICFFSWILMIGGLCSASYEVLLQNASYGPTVAIVTAPPPISCHSVILHRGP